MKLIAKVREKARKKDAKRIRRTGDIPAILYAPGKPSEKLQIDGKVFAALLRQIKPAHLSTTKITLDLDGKKLPVLVKDIQYHPTTYNVLHLDLCELLDDVPVNVKVPINCIGVMDCAGIKLGGVLRQVIRQVKVRCLPKLLPEAFDVNVKDLGIKQSLRLSDLRIGEGIRPLAKLEEVVVVIAKR